MISKFRRLEANLPKAFYRLAAVVAVTVIGPAAQAADFTSILANGTVAPAPAKNGGALTTLSNGAQAMLSRLGVNSAPSSTALQGGEPYEPADAPGGPLSNANQQFRSLFLNWKHMGEAYQSTVAVPSQKPVESAVFTSGFGARSDPFNGYVAMHAGIDLAGPIGTPIYAAADGIVDRAGWANGYGNLVEIDHGKSIQTRYGHLSAILVTEGQRVHRGDLIARMGSTGRSTGSHLHYEVRLDGHAVNPIPFLQSSDYLLAVQRRAGQAEMAMGGPGPDAAN
jgi:murein DD-endopeptidase MepM/ murein hydrolase activator NlpD